jgi:putative aldouronate transport system permease protein
LSFIEREVAKLSRAIRGKGNDQIILNCKSTGFLKLCRRDYQLILLCIPAVAIVFTFNYIPLYGIVMAFQDFSPSLGVFRSPWIGFENFKQFVNSIFIWRLTRNTVLLGFYTLLFGFPAPIIFALLLNEVKLSMFKRVTQTISYLPSFLSVVTIIGIIQTMTNRDNGVINIILSKIGLERISFLTSSEWFRPLYIISGIWANLGMGSIIYLAALSGIDVELYDSAYIDGAGKWQQMIHITLPSITPTIMILLILASSNIVNNDFIKVILLQTPLSYETSDVISTYVYREGLMGARYSYGTAVGLLNMVVAFFILNITNFIAKKFSEYSLY